MKNAATTKGFIIVPDFPPLKNGVVVPVRDGDDYLAAVAGVLERYMNLDADAVEYARKNPDEAVQRLIDQYQMTYIVRVGDEISVYSPSRRQKLPMDVARRVMNEMGINPRTPVGWYATTDGNPHFSTAAQVLFGEKKSAAMPSKAKRPSKSVLNWTGPVDWEEAGDIVDRMIGPQ